VCNAELWAACIGGAAQQNDYREAIQMAGLTVERIEENPQYQFTSDRAKRATAKYGVKSVSVLARKL
jgi:arsenite methyltransferase